jgi:hypothetical protein
VDAVRRLAPHVAAVKQQDMIGRWPETSCGHSAAVRFRLRDPTGLPDHVGGRDPAAFGLTMDG